MRLSLGQHQKQVQKQVQTQRMIQAMEILQLTTQALQEKIQEELQENPTLEVQEDSAYPPDENREDADSSENSTIEERVLEIGKGDESADFERLSGMDGEISDFSDDNYRPSQSYLEDLSERHADLFANIQARGETLQEHLQSQLFWMNLPETLRDAAEKIIFNLDSRGFLQTVLADLFTEEENIPPADGGKTLPEAAMDVVKTLEPRGVGAADLRECLLLQLDADDPDYLRVQELISEHLPDVEHNRLPLIARKMGISLEALDELLQKLRRLNPNPGREFHETITENVIPDVFCTQQEDGRWVVSLDETVFPPLYVNHDYRAMLRDRHVPEETRGYIRKKLGAAQWLIESIIQRQNTLLRVSQAIIDYQKDFLNLGPEAMRPLKMQQIADDLGIHVTTVSRAVDGKWIQTPRGIFALRRFFVGGISQTDGEESISRDKIQLKLKEIVENEDKTNPLSDEAITAELQRCGFTINRRTVVKYRQAMNIPSSRQRKVWK